MRLAATLILLSASTLTAADGNRLAYLDECDPYYPHRTFPKLVTPQWVGEPGVGRRHPRHRRHARAREVGSLPAAHPGAAQKDRRPGPGQHHDVQDRPGRPTPADLAQG